MWKAMPLMFCLTASVQAGIVFETGNNPQPNDENVQFSAGASGTTIFGQMNQSGITVQFTSTTDTDVLTPFSLSTSTYSR